MKEAAKPSSPGTTLHSDRHRRYYVYFGGALSLQRFVQKLALILSRLHLGPLCWQLGLSEHSADTGGLWDPRFHYGKVLGSGVHVALQSSVRKAITHELTHMHASARSRTCKPLQTHPWPRFKLFHCTHTPESEASEHAHRRETKRVFIEL